MPWWQWGRESYVTRVGDTMVGGNGNYRGDWGYSKNGTPGGLLEMCTGLVGAHEHWRVEI